MLFPGGNTTGISNPERDSSLSSTHLQWISHPKGNLHQSDCCEEERSLHHWPDLYSMLLFALKKEMQDRNLQCPSRKVKGKQWTVNLDVGLKHSSWKGNMYLDVEAQTRKICQVWKRYRVDWEIQCRQSQHSKEQNWETNKMEPYQHCRWIME